MTSGRRGSCGWVSLEVLKDIDRSGRSKKLCQFLYQLYVAESGGLASGLLQKEGR